MGRRRRGTPLIRESAWLYPPGRGALPIALVRLYDVVEADEWEVALVDTRTEERQSWRYPDEAPARDAQAQVYAQTADYGEWRVTKHLPF